MKWLLALAPSLAHKYKQVLKSLGLTLLPDSNVQTCRCECLGTGLKITVNMPNKLFKVVESQYTTTKNFFFETLRYKLFSRVQVQRKV